MITPTTQPMVWDEASPYYSNNKSITNNIFRPQAPIYFEPFGEQSIKIQLKTIVLLHIYLKYTCL